MYEKEKKHKEQAMAVYLFLDSRDSTVFHPFNTPDDFIVTLPKPYVIDDSWECAILELNIDMHQDVSTARLYVFCDIVGDSYVKNTMLPILRPITLEGGANQMTYMNPFYIKVSKQEISQIRIFIRNQDLSALHSQVNFFNCTLCLRKKKLWDQ